MTHTGYATTSFPRPARYGVDTPQPARFLADMVLGALRHGMPARRPAGPAVAWVARRHLSPAPLAGVLRRLPARPAPDLDALLARISGQWPRWAEGSTRLAPSPPPLAALAVRRSAARTVFVFGADDPAPLVVIKQPHQPAGTIAAEAAALQAVAPAMVAPRWLGWLDGAAVQEGLPGSPAAVSPTGPATAAELNWSEHLDGLSRGLGRLAAVSARAQPPDHLLAELDTAAGYDLDEQTRRLLRAASRDLATLRTAVRQHGDLSAQNWLVNGTGFVGLVDWELTKPAGVPGFDLWNAAVALLEHGVGLRRWSEARVLAAFGAAWTNAPLFARGREAARQTALAGGVADHYLDPLEVAFFARRLARRVRNPEGYATSPAVAASMLRLACAS